MDSDLTLSVIPSSNSIEIALITVLCHHRPYFTALNDYNVNVQTPFLPQGVRLTYVTAINGAAATFTCNSEEYPVVQEATRTVFQCKQDLSAFMRFPCPTINTTTCTVNYDQK